MSDKRDGLIWSYRLLLDRDPTEAEIEAARPSTDDARAVSRSLIGSREFADQLYRPVQAPAELGPQERRAAVLWAFRLLMGREITNESDIEFMVAHHPTVAKLRNTLLFSDEFRLLRDRSLDPLLLSSVVREFRPLCTEAAAPGSFRDFLGNSARCSFLPPSPHSSSGFVSGPPGAIDRPPLHDPAEWIGTLRSVLEARDRFTVVELGAGWAPWLVAGHNAARRKGISEIHLVGVEGSLDHVEYMRQNFVDNGLDPDAHRLIYGVVGVADGTARFPKLAKPAEDYGAAADFDGNVIAREMVEVPCFSLRTLLAGLPPVIDLIHCDVQGAEAEVMGAALPVLNERVRRVVIGTHARRVEGLLLEQFSAFGWRLEHEGICTYQQALSGQLLLIKDGEQVWSNPRL